MKTKNQVQAELAASAFSLAAKRLEEIATQVRRTKGVHSATVHAPTAGEIEDALEDGDILVPSITVECRRGHTADLDLTPHLLTRIGDGVGDTGPFWIYAL